MLLPPDIVLQRRLQQWSGYLVIGMILIALVNLLGWQFNISFFVRPFRDHVAMNPVSALCFLLAAISFRLMIQRRQLPVAIAVAAVILVVGMIKLGQISLGYHFAIDQLLFPSRLIADTAAGNTNQMSPNGAFCLMIGGVALLLRRGDKGNSWQYLALLMGLMGLLALLGYLYRVQNFGGLLTHIPMPLGSAICILLFSLAMLFSEPSAGIMKEFTSSYSGSVMARLLIPAAILIPAALSLLRLYGNWEGFYSYEFGVAIYVLSVIIIFVGIIWYNAQLLNRRDSMKRQTEDALRSSEQHIRAIFDNAPDAVIIIDDAGNITGWNPAAQKLFGWKKDEALGKRLTRLLIREESWATLDSDLERYLSTSESNMINQSVDLSAITKERSQLDVSMRLSPLPTDEGQYFVGFIRDITERKKMEIRLKTFNEELSKSVAEKTAELREIFERITDGFVGLDKDFRYTYMNNKAGKLIHEDPAQLIGKNIWQTFPQLIGTNTYLAFNEAMEKQQYTSNTDYFEALGVWLENYVYPSPNGLSVFIRDISEQKRSELEINRAKDLAEKLIDSLPGVFYFFDATGKFIRWNKHLEEVTGYSGAEIENMHPVDLFGNDEKEYIAQRIKGVFEQGVNDADASFLTKDGRLVPFYFKAVRIMYDGEPCLLGNGVDITERKRYESELLSSEQKYKLLFASNPLPMWMLSLPEYNIIDVNNVALVQYGYDREEFLKLSVTDFRPPEDVERFKSATNTNFRGLHNAGIWRHKKKDGSILFVDIVTHDIVYKGQTARLVLANNVTEKYIAEERLKESYEAIRTLTGHIQNAREEERSHIAREIHDELGQLLTVLKMDVSWLNKRIEPTNEVAKEKTGEILSLIDTTVKTVRRIASELRPSLLDDLGLQPAMEWYLEEFERRSGITKDSHISDIELQVPDALKIGLFRIFQESLTNVARHSSATNVYVSLQQRDKQLILTIKDNGTGFEEKREGSKKTLGLLGMKERTKMMGGIYNITAKAGVGTTFSVIVPLP